MPKQVQGPQQGTGRVKEQWRGQCGKEEMNPRPQLIIGNSDNFSLDV